jgi:hypothetical protein
VLEGKYLSRNLIFMSETATLPRFIKDLDRIPLPGPRAKGLTAMLRELAVGESLTMPRAAAGDVYKLGSTLGKRFVARAISEERARVWRTA